jgi:hypothetical protein
MTTVAVWKEVNPYQSMMEPCGNFIRWIGAIFGPETDIIQKLPKFHRDAIGINADILACTAICARPFPNPSEHAFVQMIGQTFF